MSKPLRSLSGLIEFESAARWNSFKLAAKELHRTPAAVSQQIKKLEAQLGFELFLRLPRQVKLTEKGGALALAVARTLIELNETIDDLRRGHEEEIVRISIPHSLSMKWLVPRLASFSALYPDIDLRLEATDRRVDVDTEPVDLAIRITGQTLSADSLVLGKEDFVVVYSPRLKPAGQPLELDDLQRFPLIYQQTPEQWLQWMQQNRVLQGRHNFERSFSHSGMLVQAAVAAQGIALVPYVIAHEDLQQGSLKQLPGTPLASSCRYCVLMARERANAGRVSAFCEWLQEEFVEMERDRVVANGCVH
ncbi:MAG: LysR substrate-binding domain-containing protein [Gammaproteobacteria bacterium]|nr:LysR substrate-binding domain-containing protein [Gammaproteobacteria bacterium]